VQQTGQSKHYTLDQKQGLIRNIQHAVDETEVQWNDRFRQ